MRNIKIYQCSDLQITFVYEGEMEKFSAHKESSRLPILVLIVLGSSGTGKTFISEIIEQNFPVKVNFNRILN